MQTGPLHDSDMRLPKPKSAPGILLYFISAAAFILVVRIAWVLVGQNVETVSAQKGYDKLLSRHWTAIMNWLAVNGFWLSLTTTAFLGAALALWAFVVLQPALVESRRSKRLDGMPVGENGIPHPAAVRSVDRVTAGLHETPAFAGVTAFALSSPAGAAARRPAPSAPFAASRTP
jgi:hypothetical protein